MFFSIEVVQCHPVETPYTPNRQDVQDAADKRNMKTDKPLRALFDADTFTYFGLSKLISGHVHAMYGVYGVSPVCLLLWAVKLSCDGKSFCSPSPGTKANR